MWVSTCKSLVVRLVEERCWVGISDCLFTLTNTHWHKLEQDMHWSRIPINAYFMCGFQCDVCADDIHVFTRRQQLYSYSTIRVCRLIGDAAERSSSFRNRMEPNASALYPMLFNMNTIYIFSHLRSYMFCTVHPNPFQGSRHKMTWWRLDGWLIVYCVAMSVNVDVCVYASEYTCCVVC